MTGDAPAEILARLDEWGASGVREAGNGAYWLIPAAPCPCGAFSRTSKFHAVAYHDSADDWNTLGDAATEAPA